MNSGIITCPYDMQPLTLKGVLQERRVVVLATITCSTLKKKVRAVFEDQSGAKSMFLFFPNCSIVSQKSNFDLK